MADPTASDLDELRRIFGERFLGDRSGDRSARGSRLSRYATDQVGDDRYRQTPAAVVFPASTDEVVALVKWANATGTPITPRGAGSGLAGAAVPVAGGVVCSFERMNRILEIDEANLMVTVEPGVVTNALDAALAESGLFFAGYPMSEDICFVGGNVAENAGGGRAVKYGVTAQYVIGAEVVTPTGRILRIGGKRMKDVTGYNLLGLFIGSEGTLGLFTRITLRVVPRPARRAVLLVGFPRAAEAAAAVSELKRGLSNAPSSIEFMDGPTARSTNDALPSSQRTDLLPDSEAYLLVEIDGGPERDLEQDLRQVAMLVREGHGQVMESGVDARTSEQAWRLRKQVPWWVKRSAGQYHSLEDVVVPPAQVAELVDYVDRLRREYAVPVAMFGHAGDGNFHVTPMKPETMETERWQETIDALLRDLYAYVKQLGGTISGEHGIGRKRVKYLAEFVDPDQLAVMRQIKQTLDPRGILNPGVILADE